MTDIIGKKFGRLTVLSYNPQTKKYVCRCDCGNIHEVNKSHLTHGLIRSCGCLFAEGNNRKHGGKNERLYYIWKTMRQRCNNPNNNNYNGYGARGIKVCEEWNDYAVFREWALSNGYEDTLTIDRKDVNGNYCPDNCQWATRKQQSRNRRNSVYLTYNEQTKTIGEWAEEYGMLPQTLCGRISSNWPIEKALLTPVKPKK